MLQNIRVECDYILENLRVHAQVRLDCTHYSHVGEIVARVRLF